MATTMTTSRRLQAQRVGATMPLPRMRTCWGRKTVGRTHTSRFEERDLLSLLRGFVCLRSAGGWPAHTDPFGGPDYCCCCRATRRGRSLVLGCMLRSLFNYFSFYSTTLRELFIAQHYGSGDCG